MQHDTPNAQPGVRSGVLSRPSSTLGRWAAAEMVGSIVLLFGLTAIVRQGSDDLAGWQGVAFVVVLVCLVASWVMGLIALVRRHERSWLVILPTAVLTLAVLNELIQGLLQLAGLGSE